MATSPSAKPSRLTVTSRRLNEGVTAHVIGWTSQPAADPKPEVPVTALQGYQAAAQQVEQRLDLAEKVRPKRLKPGYRQSAAYRQGLWEGLLFAHSMHALGQFPQSNETPIRAYLLAHPATQLSTHSGGIDQA